MSTLPANWHIPLVQWLLIQPLAGIVVAFTAPRAPARPATALLLIALAYSMQRSAQLYYGGTRFGAPLISMCWVNVLNAVDLLVLSRVSFEAQKLWEFAKYARANGSLAKQPHSPNPKQQPEQTQKESASSARLARLRWALNIAFNYRRIDTPWEIRGLPRFDDAVPGYVPSRARFLGRAGVKVAIAVVVIQGCTMETDDKNLGKAVALLPEAREALCPWANGAMAAGWEEFGRRMLVRALFCLSFGIVGRATIIASYNVFAIVAVGLGLDEPVKWPPVAGSLWEGWSIRRFWGITWHQTFRQLLTANADFLLALMRISPKGRLGWTLRALLAFTVSGVIHLFMDVGFGVPMAKSGALWFFCLQIVGVVIESIVRDLFQPLRARMNPGVKRVIGYVWVALFMLWTVPIWINPILIQLYSDGVRMMSPFLCFGSWES
ncbi:putative toxin biosynthesis protein [Aspergillus uvarum CBS 121591]|uniref:Putative toxin biosynthesis protein n=1 Tax=Aspergillus uvarum CBS 121591 TaxID=1448315 RepID=A0A319C8Q6_9EURO|nr:putative toxin biosynthesis protein [Aspergillus uvarum CBS 121591]PYH81624.1 putative toxin biosynthesis protein [Aspergillus uvarum CBS 121591]